MEVGEVQQPVVTSGAGAGRGLSQHATEVGDGGGGQGVAVGVDADDAVDELCQHDHAEVPPGEGRP